MGSGSNLVRPLWIGGWGSIRAGKRRRPTAGGSVRGSAAPGSPELVESDGPGSNRPGFGSDGIYATRVFYWGQKRGSAGVRAALGSGRSLGTRRSFCAALRRLEGGGAASPRWCGLCSGAGVAGLALGFEGGGAGRDETQGGAGHYL